MEPRHGSPRRSALRALPSAELGADRCAHQRSVTRSGPSPAPPPPSTPTPRPCPRFDGRLRGGQSDRRSTRRPGSVGKSGRHCGGAATVPYLLGRGKVKGRRLSVFEHGHAASLELPLAPAPGVPSLWSNRPFEEHRRSLIDVRSDFPGSCTAVVVGVLPQNEGSPGVNQCGTGGGGGAR